MSGCWKPSQSVLEADQNQRGIPKPGQPAEIIVCGDSECLQEMDNADTKLVPIPFTAGNIF